MSKKREKEHCNVQKQGKKRDLYRCQVCGSAVNAEGHHVIEYQYGGAASTDNIVTLCRACHMQVHRGKIDLLMI